MTQSFVDACVCIKVIDKQGKVSATGTGVFVGEGKVLTSFHVIAANVAVKYEVCGGQETNDSYGSAELVWPKSAQEIVADEFDVAILQLNETSKTPRGQLVRVNTTPTSGSRWESAAYPKAKTTNVNGASVLTRTGIVGTLYASGKDDKTLQVGVEDPPAVVTDWQGASGAPVIANGWVIGVLCRLEPTFKSLLAAVPLARVAAKCQGFAEALFGPVDHAALLELRRELENDLSDSEVAQTIAGRVPAWLESWSVGKVSGLVDRLLSSPLMDVVKQLDFANRDLHQRGRTIAAETSVRVTNRLLALFGSGPEYRFSADPSIGPGFYRLRTATRTFAELAIAGWQGRECLWVESRARADSRSGEVEARGALLTPTLRGTPKEPGQPNQQSDHADELFKLLFDKFVKPDWRTSVREQMWPVIAEEMEFQRESPDFGIRYYLLVDRQFVEKYRTFILEVCQSLPNVPIFELPDRENVNLSAETGIVRWIGSIIGRNAKDPQP
jgi:hypothetical protein